MPMSLHKIINEAKLNTSLDQDYQSSMVQLNAREFKREQQRNQYYTDLKKDIEVRAMQGRMEAQQRELLQDEMRR